MNGYDCGLIHNLQSAIRNLQFFLLGLPGRDLGHELVAADADGHAQAHFILNLRAQLLSHLPGLALLGQVQVEIIERCNLDQRRTFLTDRQNAPRCLLVAWILAGNDNQLAAQMTCLRQAHPRTDTVAARLVAATGGHAGADHDRLAAQLRIIALLD